MKANRFIELLLGLTITGSYASDLSTSSSKTDSSTKDLVAQAVMPDSSSNFCQIDKDEPVGATCDVTFKEINEINRQIRSDLLALVHSDFFKYFKLDLYKQCPFWNDNDGYCVNRACAVDVVEEWDTLPAYWQPEVLGGLDNESFGGENIASDECAFLDQLCEGQKNGALSKPDVNYCDLEDFSNEKSVLVDLTANPERFTGYGGMQSTQIWSSIYKENCFSSEQAGTCLAKNAFYRLISGLHASIGTHLSNDHLNTETGAWEPNLELFMARVGNFPDRVANIYFNYAVIAKALWKIRPYLSHLDFCNAYHEDVKSMINSVITRLNSKIFNEDLLFKDQVTSTLKDDFRMRFKNVTKIMDCVHCDRCRLWGKVQTTGYATSLKILFEFDSEDEEGKQNVVDKLTKYELIALFNTFDRLSKSVEAITNFEKMYDSTVNSMAGKLASFLKSNNFFKLIKSSVISSTEKEEPLTRTSIDSATSSEKTQDGISQENEFKDLKFMPKKVVNNVTKTGIRQAWDTELNNVSEALRFIFRSYWDLPRNIIKFMLLKVNRMWNRFVGVPEYLQEADQDPTVYQLNIQ
ncbi:LAMI_0E16160g1_1 [Lachancea mirantina]|uniref:LAMI_0E16160g1_1 n=1 Tax=Lachancea mirantina TaxID=1230905 RepID=A0A1G4JSW5_9SACH|nr:LAMI_0E16160g1_1 [Lachancea mirantina]